MGRKKRRKKSRTQRTIAIIPGKKPVATKSIAVPPCEFPTSDSSVDDREKLSGPSARVGTNKALRHHSESLLKRVFVFFWRAFVALAVLFGLAGGYVAYVQLTPTIVVTNPVVLDPE